MMSQLKGYFTQELPVINQADITNEEENQHFRSFLKQQDSVHVDNVVQRLNSLVSAQIDCTKCGNCCRSLMINIEPGESERLSSHLNIPIQDFKDKFVEESQQGHLVINTIPCHFLNESKCSIYENRFSECREFPHLHKPGFIGRSFSTFMHYGRCPIVFNVIEQLKDELSFRVYPETARFFK